MTALREAAMRQALEALEGGADSWQLVGPAIDALKAALAEPEQEPVAWLTPRTVDSYMRPDLGYETCSKTDYAAFPVYTAPPQRKPRHVSYVCPQCHWSLDERKPLTEEEIEKATREVWRNLPSEFDHTSLGWIEQGIRYAERAHGIGENT